MERRIGTVVFAILTVIMMVGFGFATDVLPSIQCSDSDNGQNLFVKGTGKGNYVGAVEGQPVIIGDPTGTGAMILSPYDYSVLYDYCYSDYQINEAFCDEDGMLNYVATLCPSGYICSAGACKPAVSPSNQPPVITDMSGSTSLLVDQAGKWKVSAYDPEGSTIYYSVNWGEGEYATADSAARTGPSATFEHTYTRAGTYKITFTVVDSAGAQTQSTATIVVGSFQTGLKVGRIWMEPDLLNYADVVLLANVTYNSQPASAQDMIVHFTLIDTRGITLIDGRVGYYGQYYRVGIGTTGQPCGTMKLTVKAEGYGQTATGAETLTLSYPYCTDNSANLPPVISDLSGSESLSVSEKGKWKVSAYDPDGRMGSDDLTFGVSWGDSDRSATSTPSTSQAGTTTFEHAYSRAGTYTVTFTVTDEQGASATKSTKVTVGEAAASEVYASVGAIPTEIYQYDSVYVTGKVSRGTCTSEICTADMTKKTYRVVLTLDNSNSVSASTYQSGSIASNREESSAATGSVTQVPNQGKEEEITLAPGETQGVSAYFTASKLGTNFAKLLVYEKMDVCIAKANNGISENNAACRGTYQLVASDSVKVFVKQGGIPSPPSEKITLKLVPGWNQVSVPTGYDVQLSDMQRKCSITSAWYYNPALGQYSPATTFGKGILGFWIKANSACTYELDEPYAQVWSTNLKAGWNMIGAPATSAKLSEMAGNCKITSGAWHYSQVATSSQATNGEYVYSSTLEPGMGYWVKVSSDCTMQSIVDSPPALPSG